MRLPPRACCSSLLLVAACAASPGLPASPPGVVPESITVTSKSFGQGGAIPVDFTCDGKNASPDVTWSSPPEGTKALVITFDDQEASTGAATGWLVMDIRPDARSLAAGADPESVGAKLGKNASNDPGYKGPCPPPREGHHYTLRVTALDRPLGLAEGADREHVNAAMSGHVLGSGELVGTAFR